MTNLTKLFGEFEQIKAGVIGDVMLDTYWWGHVERISPEAPVPVVSFDRIEYRIGGAGNVALNLASLGAAVTAFSVIGEDEDGRRLCGMLEKDRIDTSRVLRSSDRMTTNKTRVMGRNQQMMRLDAETTRDLTPMEQDRLLRALGEYIEHERPQVVIFEDYNKGVLTERVIAEAISMCSRAGVVTTVDPKRKNFFAYKGVTMFKPNLKEVKEGLNILLEDIRLPALQHIHAQLAEKLGHRISFITLSEKGVFFEEPGLSELIPSHLRNIADVSGAGDTVIAVASLVYAVTRDTRLMAEVANIAGGLVCEEVGTVAINKKKLLEECSLLLK